LAFISLFLFLFGGVVNAELLNNGNFSAGSSGWTHWNANVRSEFDGSGQLATKAWGNGGTWSAGGAFQDVAGVAGQEYTLRADIAIDPAEPLPVNGGSAITKLEFYDAGGTLINGPYGTDISVVVNDGATAPIGEWIPVTGSMTAPAGTATVRAVVMVLDTGGGVSVAWFDNVSLTGPAAPVTNDPDYNNDGDVDFVDFSGLAGVWNQVSSIRNLAGEELIDLEDLEVFAAAWLRESPYPGYALAWSDEFNGSSINTAIWNWEIGDSGWGNNEWQYYTNHPENSYISNGNLVIVARENHLGHDYTSARMTTQNKQSFLYGKMEARIKLPTGQGLWPAFWMMPADSAYGGWASSGEIDIMEMINQATTIYGTLHFGGGWPNNQSTGGSYSPGGVDFSEDFHVYMLEWEPDVMRWYVDGVLFSTKTSSQWWSDGAPGNPRAPFDQPFFFILNVAVGGNWPGYPDASTSFPQSMYVDYVRVYQLIQ
jgi:beta-glucanase (GH16 family)